jgi:hypothetical protein
VFSGGASAGISSAKTDVSSTGRITGIDGIFVRSRNPKALVAWYRDVLGY